MDFDLTPDEVAFRDEVRAFLDANLPPEDRRDAAFARDWQRKLREKRWVGFAWPRELGGVERVDARKPHAGRWIATRPNRVSDSWQGTCLMLDSLRRGRLRVTACASMGCARRRSRGVPATVG